MSDDKSNDPTDSPTRIARRESINQDPREISFNNYGDAEMKDPTPRTGTNAIAKEMCDSAEAGKRYGISGPVEKDMSDSMPYNTFDWARTVNAESGENIFPEGAHSDSVIDQIANAIMAAKQERKRR